ncbi:MAG TPA: hypothetical protein VFG19_05110 [Geobacteraceae bacterium]|nr:hypothetical protein [Geobacteraceae bacterium]
MGDSARKLNFMIKEEVAKELEALVPAGRRSKLVNEAISKELALYRRRVQTERLKELRKKTPKVSTDEIVAALRHDRERE